MKGKNIAKVHDKTSEIPSSSESRELPHFNVYRDSKPPSTGDSSSASIQNKPESSLAGAKLELADISTKIEEVRGVLEKIREKGKIEARIRRLDQEFKPFV